MITISTTSLAILGLVLASVLAIASKLLAVEEDPRVESLTEALPGANCGGCGYAGCEAYAIAVLSSPDVAANLCTVGGPDTTKIVSEMSGKVAELKDPTTCFRRCSRIEGNVKLNFAYDGVNTCAASVILEDGPYKCKFACVGLGDCAESCQFDAIEIVDGLPIINKNKCVSCGMCVKSCPRNILEIMLKQARVMIVCNTKDKLKAVSDVCGVGCIACMRCLKACPAKAISYENDRIVFDHKKCLEYGDSCNLACASSCGRKIIKPLTEPAMKQTTGIDISANKSINDASLESAQ